ncbi:23071_t:CDS:2, partial [Gigaspora rosea]
YQQAFEILSQTCQNGVSKTDLAVHLHFNAATNQRHYNLPTTNEIAIILPGDDFVLEGMHQSNAPRLTQMDFYSFQLFLHYAEFSTIPCGEKLFW